MRLDWLWRNWGKNRPLWEGMPYRDIRKVKDFLTQHKYNAMAETIGKWGVDEVIDTLGYVVHAAGPNGVRKAIPKKGEKFDLVKFLFAAANEYPEIKEAVEDFSTFWQQLKDIFPEESKQVAAALRQKYPNPDPVQEELLYNIENLALTQEWIQYSVLGNGSDLLKRWGKK